MFRCLLASLLLVTFVASSAEAQLLPRLRSYQNGCENGQCFAPPWSAPAAGYFGVGQRDYDGAVITSVGWQPVLSGSAVGVPVLQQTSQRQVATIVGIYSQVRLSVGNVGGSGTAVGADSTGVYILTNAHVAGTQIGRVINVDIDTDQNTHNRQRVTGRVVWAAYSDAKLIDAAIIKIDAGLVQFPPYLPLSKSVPSDPPYATRGHARFVWPSELKQFNNPTIKSDSPLMLGDPDAIGGQSGSSIYNSKGVTVGLLTWSWGGRCAGQQTHWLWKVYRERSILGVPDRPQGLTEVADGPRMPCENGVFYDDSQLHPALNEMASPRSPTEIGIFSLVDSTIADLPIWYEPPTDPEPPIVDPPAGDCHTLTGKEWDLIQFLRNQQSETGRFGEFLKTIDWVELFKTIITIIKMFQGM